MLGWLVAFSPLTRRSPEQLGVLTYFRCGAGWGPADSGRRYSVERFGPMLRCAAVSFPGPLGWLEDQSPCLGCRDLRTASLLDAQQADSPGLGYANTLWGRFNERFPGCMALFHTQGPITGRGESGWVSKPLSEKLSPGSSGRLCTKAG